VSREFQRDHLQWFQHSTHIFSFSNILHHFISLSPNITTHSTFTLSIGFFSFKKKNLTLYPTTVYFIFLFTLIFLFL